jgi:hypothetical protein
LLAKWTSGWSREDYLPRKAFSREASAEESVREGHISTLHFWWERRSLVAAEPLFMERCFLRFTLRQ